VLHYGPLLSVSLPPQLHSTTSIVALIYCHHPTDTILHVAVLVPLGDCLRRRSSSLPAVLAPVLPMMLLKYLTSSLSTIRRTMSRTGKICMQCMCVCACVRVCAVGCVFNPLTRKTSHRLPASPINLCGTLVCTSTFPCSHNGSKVFQH